MKATLFLVLATLFWAGNFVFGAAVVGEVDPVSLTWIRWAFAAVPLVVVAQLIEKPDWRRAVPHLPLLGLLGVLGITGFSVLIYVALRYTSPLNASLINSVNPALIVVLAAVLPAAVQGGVRERLTWRSVAGILLGLAGVIIVITDGDLLALLRNGLNLGDLLMIGVIVVWSVYTLVGRRIHDVPPITATAIQVVLATVLLTPFLAMSGLQWPSSGPGWAAIGYIVVFPSIAAYVLWNAATRLVSPATASIYINLQVVFTALIGLPFGFGITWVQVVGGIVVVAAVVLLARGQPNGSRIATSSVPHPSMPSMPESSGEK